MSIRAFRRFCARRGLPATIISDNAKTFKSSAKEIQKLLRSPRLDEYLSLRKVKWKFIVELAPWQGGHWERLIRSVKRCLLKVIGRSLLSNSELGTILVEVESFINSRPITYLFDDKEGISYPLSPSHLVNGRNLELSSNDSHFEIISTYESLSKRARYHHRLLYEFTKLWKNEYLLGLLEAYKPKNSNAESRIEVGDIVVLRNEQTKRSFWKLCKVLELLKGQDGSVRSAKIQVASGEGKNKTFTRAIKFLIPLEVRCRTNGTDSSNKIFKATNPKQLSMQQDTQQRAQPLQNTQPAQQATQRIAQQPARPKRNAAVIGELVRRDQVS